MLTNLKRRTALLLTAAVLCSVTALAPTTAGAAASIPPNAGTSGDPYVQPLQVETYDACPGASAPTGTFTDTSATDVDCLAMFGITTGTTATTYEPTGTIPRWQMALYIHRMFVPTGVAAAGTTTVPAFTDTSGLSTEIQNAINALASHSITLGTSSTTFSPDDLVTREQMALFLNRFASIAKDHAGVAIVSTGVVTNSYNYSDLTQVTFEGMEAIVRLYNLGVTGETCTSTTVTTCASTYRPSENITRAEMATMVDALLNHTNARPAGVSIQSLESLATTGPKTTLMSVRNADFSVQANTLVDEFFQNHSDGTTSVPVTAKPAFDSLGACTANVTKTIGTLCTIDAQDRSTDTYGNVAGTTQTMAANYTTNWWVWTGTTGGVYNSGTTTTGFALSAPLGAAAATSEYSTAATTFSVSGSQSGGTVLGYALPGNYSAYNAVLDGTDGIYTKAGTSRTVTAQLKGANYAAGTTVVDGYTLKFSDEKVDMLGNVTITDTYVASSGGTATYTVTCGADNSALTTGVGNASSSYWEAHEITVTEATASGTAVGVSRPTGSNAVTFGYSGDGQNNSTINIACDDATPSYSSGAASTTFAISANNYPISTAGALMSATATAYDQYGNGIAGQTANFQKGGATQATLTTGADGTSTLTAIVCTAAGTAAWSTEATLVTMSAIAATTPTNLIDGTTVYCTTPINQDGAYQTATSGDPVTILTASQDDTSAGSLTLTVCSISQAGHFLNPSKTAGLTGAPLCLTTDSIDAISANLAADCQTKLRALTNVDATTTCATADNAIFTITFPANTGNWSVIATPTGTTDGADATTYTITEDGTGGSTLGIADQDLNYIDNDPTGNTVVVSNAHEYATTAGAAATATTYHVLTYDSGDSFMLTAAGDVASTVVGASEAQFETELASLTGLMTAISGTEREGVLTSGISFWNIGS